MKSVQINQYGGEEQLKLVDTAKPVPGAGQIIVRIAATSFNPFDAKLTSGNMQQIFPIQFPFVPGVDFSGVVESVGEGVKNFRPGDEVFGTGGLGGAYAEFIAADANMVLFKPKSLNHVEAASLALVSQTALQMVDRAGLKKGQTVLIHGAGGAVGAVAVQIAHQRGLKVIAGASASGLNRVKGYGADEVINYAKAPFESVVKNVDAVLDTIGGDVQQRSYSTLKPGGVLVAITQPPSQEEAAKHQVSASLVNTEASAATLEAIAKLIEAGDIKPFVGKVYPLSQVAQAWRDRRSSHIEGKTVFTLAA